VLRGGFRGRATMGSQPPRRGRETGKQKREKEKEGRGRKGVKR